MTKIVCWNMDKRKEPWCQLLKLDADVALLQEALMPPPDEASHLIADIPRAHWDSHVCFREGRFKSLFDRWTMVVKLSDRVEVDWFSLVAPISETTGEEFAVSGIGTVAAARVRPRDREDFIVVSMYARWIEPHPSTGSWWTGYPDGSAHRIISDLSAFIGSADPSSHRILAAGDLNTIYGAKDKPAATPERDETIWLRMNALGLEFLGPQAPNGRQAEPQPEFMPPETKNVVTFGRKAPKEPAKADRQLDYVFASRGFHEHIRTCALNSVEKWGASDHCRLLIEVSG